VENALYHGIKNRRGMGMITVTGEEKDDDLLLKVSDNGAGMDEERVRELQAGIYEDKHTGLGLVNVHKRIRLYCGDTYGLSFESTSGKGTVVTVRLPMNRGSAE
jgi:two-component system sensor histidine kinase YesM